MPYVYETIKNILAGDEKVSKKSWSPNIYRCIVIGADYIFIAYHGGIKQNKIVPLDSSLVVMDIQKSMAGSYRGSVNNLLQERQLSCLEEIYLDVAYIGCPSIFDMERYIKSVRSSVSRLRYYGYCETTGDYSWMIESYSRENPVYTIAADKKKSGIKLKSVATGTEDWYKKYNLRPMNYSGDADNGRLAIWFRSNEKKIEKMIEETEFYQQRDAVFKKLKSICQVDSDNIKYYRALREMLIYIQSNKKDEVCKLAIEVVQEAVKVDRVIKGFTEDLVSQVVNADVTLMLSMYKMFKVLDVSGNTVVDKSQIDEIYKSGVGALNLMDLLDLISDNLSVRVGKLFPTVIKVAVFRCKDTLPNGRTRSRVTGVEGTATLPDGYFQFLGNVIGNRFEIV